MPRFRDYRGGAESAPHVIRRILEAMSIRVNEQSPKLERSAGSHQDFNP